MPDYQPPPFDASNYKGILPDRLQPHVDLWIDYPSDIAMLRTIGKDPIEMDVEELRYLALRLNQCADEIEEIDRKADELRKANP
jgi:hypothetical protein